MDDGSTEMLTRDLVGKYKSAMSNVPSPVAVVTFQTKDGCDGVTCTAICSVTTEPPMLAVCLKHVTAAPLLIAEAGAFAVNFVSENQSDIARRFSEPHPDPAARFEFGQWQQRATGAPILAGAISWFDCRIVRHVEEGAHRVFFGGVIETDTAPGNGLLHRNGFFRRQASE